VLALHLALFDALIERNNLFFAKFASVRFSEFVFCRLDPLLANVRREKTGGPLRRSFFWLARAKGRLAGLARILTFRRLRRLQVFLCRAAPV